MEHSILPCHPLPHPLAGDPEKTAYLDIVSDGHFWRTSSILSAVYIVFEDGEYRKHAFSADPSREDDEFRLLEALVPLLRGDGIFYTFNGTSFVLPYLGRKLKAYDLPYPLESAQHRDLYRILKPLYYMLRLPSRRMSDYLPFTGCNEFYDEPLPSLTHLLPFLVFPGADVIPEEASPRLVKLSKEEPYLYMTIALPCAVPKKISYSAGPYYLIADGDTVSCSVRMENGTVRHYYPDYGNYAYLPQEGYAVHKSVAAFMPKDRQIPASWDNCFTRITVTDQFLNDPGMQEAYLASIRSLIRTSISEKTPFSAVDPENENV
ncbi:MAG: hypothetical protein E7240_09100 [Lachnospiraceae bacterium]|nr:hypothetical protein [Lachnospiraceae bacterium]